MLLAISVRRLLGLCASFRAVADNEASAMIRTCTYFVVGLRLNRQHAPRERAGLHPRPARISRHRTIGAQSWARLQQASAATASAPSGPASVPRPGGAMYPSSPPAARSMST